MARNATYNIIDVQHRLDAANGHTLITTDLSASFISFVYKDFKKFRDGIIGRTCILEHDESQVYDIVDIDLQGKSLVKMTLLLRPGKGVDPAYWSQYVAGIDPYAKDPADTKVTVYKSVAAIPVEAQGDQVLMLGSGSPTEPRRVVVRSKKTGAETHYIQNASGEWMEETQASMMRAAQLEMEHGLIWGTPGSKGPGYFYKKGDQQLTDEAIKAAEYRRYKDKVKYARCEVEGEGEVLMAVHNEDMKGYALALNGPWISEPLVPKEYKKFVRWATSFDL